MRMKNIYTNIGRMIVFEGELTKQHLKKLRVILNELFSQENKLELHIGSVSDIDIEFLRVLFSFYHTAKKLDRPVMITGNFVELFQTASKTDGYREYLDCISGGVNYVSSDFLSPEYRKSNPI